MSSYDPTNLLTRLRKQREDAEKMSRNGNGGTHRKPKEQVKVTPSFQSNSRNKNYNDGEGSPYALGSSPLNLGQYNYPLPPNRNALGGNGRLTDPRRNRGSAAMNGGGKYTIPSPLAGYKSPEFGGGAYNFGNNNNKKLPPLQNARNNIRETKGGGKSEFFMKNRHLVGASKKFQPGGFKGMGNNCRPNGGAILCFMVVFVLVQSNNCK